LKYASADPSVVESIKQPVLLKAWPRALRRPNAPTGVRASGDIVEAKQVTPSLPWHRSPA
jgi:hypothetical protein